MSGETGWGLYRPVVPEGTYLASSKGTDGALRALLFEKGTNKLLGPPELFKVDDQHEPVALSDEDKSVSLGEVIALAIVAAGAVGAVKAAPHIKRWWNARTFSSLNRTRAEKGNLASSATDEENSQATIAELVVVSKNAPANFSKAIDVALEDCRISMSNEEAQRRLAMILAAAAFIAEQIRMLSNASIEDDNDYLELKRALEKLTTRQVTDSINLMLETNTSLLDEKTSAEFMRIFGGGRIVDDKYVPILNEKVRKALRVTDSKIPSMQEFSDVEIPDEDTTGQI